MSSSRTAASYPQLTTLNTYAHLWPSAEDKTRAAASGMAAAVLSAQPTKAARRG